MDFLIILGDASRAAIGPEAAIYAMAAIGLNMHFGYTGLLNFGQVGFMLVGVALAILLALLLGVPTLRLRADYLAITTIALGEILRYIYRSNFASPVTGGVYGLTRFADPLYTINPIPPGQYGFGRLAYSSQSLWIMVISWSLVALVCVLMFLIIQSPWGRVIRSVREDEDAARSLGKNVFGYKMQSLVFGGVLGAVSGMLLAFYAQAVQPDAYSPVVTFYLYTLLILGGAGRILGPVVGSVIFWFVLVCTDSFLRQAIGAGLISASLISPTEVGAVRFALVGAGLMLLMIYRPQGILGDRREMMLGDR
ncbi:MAG TPA: branched-chain amino acid ABC transporter permease [Streptosporangiaceae bacterium]